jgi:predicted transcriptional regulator
VPRPEPRQPALELDDDEPSDTDNRIDRAPRERSIHEINTMIARLTGPEHQARIKAEVDRQLREPLPRTAEVRKMRALGYRDDQIRLAIITQQAQRRADTSGIQSIHQVLTGRRPRANASGPLAELTTSQLRVRGRLGQAALLADQQALTETDPSKAARIRELSTGLKLLSGRPQQQEFDFFMGGNTQLGHQYTDAIIQRLDESGASRVERDAALATLTLIVRHQGWQTHECQKTGVEIARMRGVDKGNMTRTLALLEKIGAITRTKRGTTKTICVTPEGVYRGVPLAHPETVDRYIKDVVVPLRRKQKTETTPAESA